MAAPEKPPPPTPPPPPKPAPKIIVADDPGKKSYPTKQAIERVAREEVESGYNLSGGTLSVVGAIGYDLDPEFRQKCDELLASGEADLVLDLSQVLYLSSSHIGVIAGLATRALGAGKKVKIRVMSKVARVLKFAGLDSLGDIEVAEE